MSLRLFLFLTLSPFFAFSQPAFSNWLKPKEGAKIEPFLAFQLWSAYSMGQEVYDTGTKQYVPAGDRFNVFFRRGRAGLKASPYDNLSFTFIAAFDGLGKDALNAALGPANNLTTPQLSLWETFLQWKAGKVILTAGYFRPQLSRESITAAWGVNSMEKAMSQTYIRKHLTGIGTGRAPGLNLGGLILPEGKNWGLNYNVGIFNPVYQAYNGNSTGFRFSPVFVGRAVLYLGEPEQTQYQTSYQINYFGERKGLSIAGGGAWQGATDLFDRSWAASTDLLFNWGPLNLDGEWNWMWRDDHFSQTGHIRAGYNLALKQRYFLEPVFMVMQFSGASDLAGQAKAKALGGYSGSETTFDAGINWYLNKSRLKLMLHYTWHQADAGEAEGTAFTGNAWFSESGVGAIRRGNWLGLGVNAIF
jgi:hypothetical protein